MRLPAVAGPPPERERVPSARSSLRFPSLPAHAAPALGSARRVSSETVGVVRRAASRWSGPRPRRMEATSGRRSRCGTRWPWPSRHGPCWETGEQRTAHWLPFKRCCRRGVPVCSVSWHGLLLLVAYSLAPKMIAAPCLGIPDEPPRW